MAAIRLSGVTKLFDGANPAVNDVSIEVEDGEFVVLVGPSGCGKSTLLRIVAGLEEVTAGEVWIGDRDVTDLDPKDRDIAMVFQNYALYPHMTVRQNIGFGLRLRKERKDSSAKRVDEAAKLLGIEDLLDRKPGQLSGGERQRVAMGRALVREPQALLMDEPLSNLDAKLRVQVRAELNRIHARLGTTTLYVTHDQIEAMTLGDRVAVMKDGVLQQLDTPSALFSQPTNVFVASFMGSPAMNLADAKVERNGDGARLLIGDQSLPAPSNVDLTSYVDSPIIFGIRPSDLAEPIDSQHRDWPTLDIFVDVVEELGTEANVLFRLASDGTNPAELHTDVVDDSDVFTATVDARTRLRARDHAKLAVDVRNIHLFDTATGLALARDHDGRLP